MRSRFWLTMERAFCTCWLYARHDWPWKVPLGRGRDEEGILNRSLGTVLYDSDTHFAVKALENA